LRDAGSITPNVKVRMNAHKPIPEPNIVHGIKVSEDMKPNGYLIVLLAQFGNLLLNSYLESSTVLPKAMRERHIVSIAVVPMVTTTGAGFPFHKG
jgi:hypothetical protein